MKTSKLKIAMQLLKLSEDIVTDEWVYRGTYEMTDDKHKLKDITQDIRRATDKLYELEV